MEDEARRHSLIEKANQREREALGCKGIGEKVCQNFHTTNGIMSSLTSDEVLQLNLLALRYNGDFATAQKATTDSASLMHTNESSRDILDEVKCCSFKDLIAEGAHGDLSRVDGYAITWAFLEDQIKQKQSFARFTDYMERHYPMLTRSLPKDFDTKGMQSEGIKHETHNSENTSDHSTDQCYVVELPMIQENGNEQIVNNKNVARYRVCLHKHPQGWQISDMASCAVGSKQCAF